MSVNPAERREPPCVRPTEWFEDFEEGTYTPFPDGADPTLRYNVNARYVKVGNIVEMHYMTVPLT